MEEINPFEAVEKLIEKLADVGLWGSFRDGCGIILGWAILFSSGLVSREQTAVALFWVGLVLLVASAVSFVVRIFWS